MKYMSSPFFNTLTAASIAVCIILACPKVIAQKVQENSSSVSPASSRKEVTAAEQAAMDFIRNLGDKAISLLTSKNITEAERNTRFKKLFHDSFADDSIGKFCLGRYWRQATEAERKEYLDLFDDSVANSYASKFAQYDPKDVFEVKSAYSKGDEGITVKSRLVKAEGSPINIDWVVYETSPNKELKIFDVVVEGVSMSVSQRSEYASIIQRTGGKISGLIQALKDKQRSKNS